MECRTQDLERGTQECWMQGLLALAKSISKLWNLVNERNTGSDGVKRNGSRKLNAHANAREARLCVVVGVRLCMLRVGISMHVS